MYSAINQKLGKKNEKKRKDSYLLSLSILRYDLMIQVYNEVLLAYFKGFFLFLSGFLVRVKGVVTKDAKFLKSKQDSSWKLTI